MHVSATVRKNYSNDSLTSDIKQKGDFSLLRVLQSTTEVIETQNVHEFQLETSISCKVAWRSV